jgi:hypothetical protein
MTRIVMRLRLNYPRYSAPLLRPAGAGAFSDFARAVATREAAKLESCSLRGAFRARGAHRSAGAAMSCEDGD